MQAARETAPRPTHRAWPSSAHDSPVPPGQGAAANPQPGQVPPPGHWPHPARGPAPLSTAVTTASSADTALLKASRYQPYRYPHHSQRQQTFEFTIHDLDKCLYGKQEMRIIQINDNPKQGGPSSSMGGGKSQGALAGVEDKNKPARWCDLCQEIRFGECPEHGPLPSLRESMTLSGPKSYAISTFPDEVGLCVSTLPLAGYGVYARHFIPIGTWIGPYEGKKITVEEGMKMIKQGDASFLWEIYENYRLAYFLDASDENNSSWMRFIQCARHRGEQNLFVFQYYGSIYYRAFKDIYVGEELLVWYDEKYPQYFGIPHEILDFSSYPTETGQPGGETPKGIPGEYERHHGEPPHAGHHHYHHHPGGSQLMQGPGGPGKAMLPSDKRSEVPGKPSHKKPMHIPTTTTKSYQGIPVQPPALSQAPIIPGDSRAHHSSIYVTAGKPQAVVQGHNSRGPSPRPGSVNTASLRDQSSSNMLRSMSEDDLRHKRKGSERPYLAHARHPYEREHLDRERLPPSHLEHMVPHFAPPPGLLVHQIPPGMMPPSHFSPATSFALLPPVMSITPLDHSKMKHEELSKTPAEMKSYYRERPPADRAREHERMLHLHDRITEHGKPGRNPVPIAGAHDILPGAETWHDGYRCKFCGKKFSHKHSFEMHNCKAGNPPLQCTKCQISFTDPRDLQEHMISHRNSNDSPPFWCGICNRSFSSATSLKNHMMKIHEKTIPPAAGEPTAKDSPKPIPECTKCGKRFAKPSDLTKHSNTPGECVS